MIQMSMSHLKIDLLLYLLTNNYMTSFKDYVMSEFSLTFKPEEWDYFNDMDDYFEDYVRELTPDQIADYFDNFAKKYPRVVVAKSLYELLED